MRIIGADFVALCNAEFDVLKQGGICFDTNGILEIAPYMQLRQKYKNVEDYRNLIPFSYVFQDVRFLGPGNIIYESNGGGTQEITVDFIYKRLRKIRNLEGGVIEVI